MIQNLETFLNSYIYASHNCYMNHPLSCLKIGGWILKCLNLKSPETISPLEVHLHELRTILFRRTFRIVSTFQNVRAKCDGWQSYSYSIIESSRAWKVMSTVFSVVFQCTAGQIHHFGCPRKSDQAVLSVLVPLSHVRLQTMSLFNSHIGCSGKK